MCLFSKDAHDEPLPSRTAVRAGRAAWRGTAPMLIQGFCRDANGLFSVTNAPGPEGSVDLDPTLEINRTLAKQLFRAFLYDTYGIRTPAYIVNSRANAQWMYAIAISLENYKFGIHYPSWLVEAGSKAGSNSNTMILRLTPIQFISQRKEFRIEGTGSGPESGGRGGAYVIDDSAEDGFFTTEVVEVFMRQTAERLTLTQNLLAASRIGPQDLIKGGEQAQREREALRGSGRIG